MDFIRVASACPKTNVADIDFNIRNIKECIDMALSCGSKLVILPELSVTSYTCGDLFNQELIYKKAIEGIQDICRYSADKDILISVGCPFKYNSCLYNSAFVIFNGKVLGIVPKSYIPNYTEFYEKRWFTEGIGITNLNIDLPFQDNIPFGTNLIFKSKELRFAIEICEDLWATIPPSSYYCLMGANIIGNLSASNEIVSKADYRKSIVLNQSAKGICSYVYSSAGVYESTTDLVFSGHLMISENGSMLAENKRFQRENQIITSIIDLSRINNERLKNVSFRDSIKLNYLKPLEISFNFKSLDYKTWDRYVDKHPFVPKDKETMEKRCEEILNIQTAGLSKRFEHTGLNKAIIGISGGLDSTLALIIIIKTFDLLNIDRKNISAVTMPGFGTTDRTYYNAVNLCKMLNTSLKEINIVDACLLHFKDIGHDPSKLDVTYENVQARERTQILMDMANKENGLLIGTGDLSELAMGWCTYNGDHMSMYAVNTSVPKTLVRHLVRYAALKEKDKKVSDILMDILDTPVSPELLPMDKNGEIKQKTEDIIGPYELHDFFLYYFARWGYSKDKILFLAQKAFRDEYSIDELNKWMNHFIKRFFTQQFKRSCIPDGPKVGTVSLSPRGDWRMPSDASFNIWK